MADDLQIQGMEACIRALNNLADDDKKFALKSMRRAARAGAKYWLSLMHRVVPSVTGLTDATLGLKAAPRRKGKIGMIVGVFDKNTYAGFANYGHKQGSSFIKGIHWTDLVESTSDEAISIMTETLSLEIEAMGWAR